MTLSLTKPSAGATDWTSSQNQNWSDIEDHVNSRRLPKGYVRGLMVRWASITTCTVGPGVARSADDSIDIALSSEVTVDITSAGAVNGLDEKSLTGTGTTDGSTTLTGSGTAFLTEFGTRDLTGTISSSSTTVTGTGTKFLSEVAVNDLIGNSSKGYWRIISIASDTSLTLSVAPASAFSSEAAKVIESPTVSAGSDKRLVRTITSDTNLTATSAFSNGGGGLSLKAGVEGFANLWYAVWAITGASGSGAYLSTQRTTLLSPPSGYTSGARRVGWVFNGGDMISTYQIGSGRERDVVWEYSVGGAFTVIISAGNAGAWTDATCNGAAPPTARQLLATSRIFQPGSETSIHFRERAAGSSTTSRNLHHIGETSDDDTSYLVIPIDGAQYLQYFGGGGSAYLYAVGYRDTL